MFTARLDQALRILLWWEVSLPTAAGLGTSSPLRSIPTLYHSMILLQNEQTTLPFAFSTNVDCINCDYAQKQHQSYRKSLLLIVLKGWHRRRAYSREYKKPMYISATKLVLLIATWKQHFGNIAWKVVGKSTAKCAWLWLEFLFGCFVGLLPYPFFLSLLP